MLRLARFSRCCTPIREGCIRGLAIESLCSVEEDSALAIVTSSTIGDGGKHLCLVYMRQDLVGMVRHLDVLLPIVFVIDPLFQLELGRREHRFDDPGNLGLLCVTTVSPGRHCFRKLVPFPVTRNRPPSVRLFNVPSPVLAMSWGLSTPIALRALATLPTIGRRREAAAMR